MNQLAKFGVVILVVAGVQFFGCATFDSDEWVRIITTALGIGGVEAIANRAKNKE